MVTPTAVPEAPKPKGDILVWGWPAADKAFASVMDGFKQEYPDINVTVQMIPGKAGGTRDALSAALAAGSGLPDISMIEINDIGRFVMQGGFVDLSKPPYNSGKYKEHFVPYKWQQASTPDGQAAGISLGYRPGWMFYRKDVFEAPGCPPTRKKWPSC